MRVRGMPEAERDALVRALAEDYTQADLSPADQAMLDYSVKLTLTPGAMNADDVARLREHGFDDRAIHDICAIAAYFGFVNRMADGLGVELEPRFADEAAP
ncbi:MAG: peroxidase [Gemmatimonadota bacterium]